MYIFINRLVFRHLMPEEDIPYVITPHCVWTGLSYSTVAHILKLRNKPVG